MLHNVIYPFICICELAGKHVPMIESITLSLNKLWSMYKEIGEAVNHSWMAMAYEDWGLTDQWYNLNIEPTLHKTRNENKPFKAWNMVILLFCLLVVSISNLQLNSLSLWIGGKCDVEFKCTIFRTNPNGTHLKWIKSKCKVSTTLLPYR